MPRPALRPWIPAASWAVVLLALSSLPGRDLGLPAGADKAAHLAGYGVLGALAALAQGTAARLRARAAAWGILALLAAADEAHQALVPGRTPDPRDWAADLAGLALGMLLVAVLLRQARKQG